MARECIWVPVGNDRDEDGSAPRKYRVWMLPDNFNEEDFNAAGRDPDVYNQRKINARLNNSSSSEQQRSTNPPEVTVSPPTPARQSPTHPSSTQPVPAHQPSNQTPASHPYPPHTSHGVPSSGTLANVPTRASIQGPQAIVGSQLAPFTGGQQVQQRMAQYQHSDSAPTFRPMRATMHAHQPQVDTYLVPPPIQGGSAALVPYNSAAQLRVAAGFSPNYQGNIFVEANRSADIPEWLNCNLFITGLDPTVTVTTLLRGVRNIGRVYAVHINAPEPWRGHLTCAAKISFFDRTSAERFYYRFARTGLQLPDHPGFRATVVWNRVRTAAVPKPTDHTRVLMIAGPPNIVNPAALYDFFTSKFVFDIDEVFDRGFDGSWQLLEYRFGSYRCQAETGKMALERELWNQVTVRFGPDPCDVVPGQWGDTGIGF
ncbi:hypothetical protein GE09DRAFT_1194840 [Coniochaeta sp. 2T2.1]|nr:hypothetical protein GE09DRAFT_1194840 [Coniochaeta sp. 2T2.1]